MNGWNATPSPLGESRWLFPPASQWPDDDVVAIGADLEPETLISGYRRGLFPMEVHGRRGVVAGWAPDPRGVIPLDGLRVTRSMKQSAKHFDVRVDSCFGDVIRGCANPSRAHGWINDAFINAYTRLHELGWA